jgi:hypothetical protein
VTGPFLVGFIVGLVCGAVIAGMILLGAESHVDCPQPVAWEPVAEHLRDNAELALVGWAGCEARARVAR